MFADVIQRKGIWITVLGSDEESDATCHEGLLEVVLPLTPVVAIEVAHGLVDELLVFDPLLGANGEKHINDSCAAITAK